MARSPRIYTKTGDDGTTGLLYGGRVRKDDPVIELNGTVDEAQAALGVVRSHAERGSELDLALIDLERDLWVLMAEVATSPENRHKLTPSATLVTKEMVTALEGHIDGLLARFEMPAAFVVPGESPVSALLDMARTVVRRAERLAMALAADRPASLVGPYLNRLSDLCWAMARWQEDQHLLARADPPDPR
ncbi:MAG: cob(I)yrinic acid a,c-diamide adenosyltransferase [Acidimicrobiales bacterium]